MKISRHGSFLYGQRVEMSDYYARLLYEQTTLCLRDVSSLIPRVDCNIHHEMSLHKVLYPVSLQAKKMRANWMYRKTEALAPLPCSKVRIYLQRRSRTHITDTMTIILLCMDQYKTAGCTIATCTRHMRGYCTAYSKRSKVRR